MRDQNPFVAVLTSLLSILTNRVKPAATAAAPEFANRRHDCPPKPSGLARGCQRGAYISTRSARRGSNHQYEGELDAQCAHGFVGTVVECLKKMKWPHRSTACIWNGGTTWTGHF